MSGPRDTGGVYMILAVKAEGAAVEQAVAQASEVIQSRCNALGVYCKVERQGGEGSNRFELRVSGAQDFPRVKSVLLAEGNLELRPVVSKPNPAPLQTYPTREAAELDARPNSEVMPFEDEGVVSEYLLVERDPVITGLDLRDASAGSDGMGRHSIDFGLKPEAAHRFGEWTDKNVGRYLAIVLNGKVRSAPSIRGRITDRGQIAGSFTREQAEDVALTLSSGKLPTPIEVLEEGRYKP
jgi:preprotein translocase subunit SecD